MAVEIGETITVIPDKQQGKTSENRSRRHRDRLETSASFNRHFPNDEICLERLFQTRFGTGSDCSRCLRSTIWHRIRAERAYSCQWCGNHLHPTVGTPLKNSRIALRLWFYAVRQPASIEPQELASALMAVFDVTRQTATRVVQRVRDSSTDWTAVAMAASRSRANDPPNCLVADENGRKLAFTCGHFT